MHLQHNLIHHYTDIQSPSNRHDFGFRETKYTHFLCFKVTQRTNKFVYSNTDRYTAKQEELHSIIKSLHDKGLGYRRIADCLNRLEVKTIKGNQWSNSNVYSVLKKYKERKERLMLRDKIYKPIWSRMKVKYELN